MCSQLPHQRLDQRNNLLSNQAASQSTVQSEGHHASEHEPASAPERVVVYSAPLVVPVSMPVIVNGAVAVRGKRVLHVGTREWVFEILRNELSAPALRSMAELHFDGLLLPGLVNAHTHLQYSGMAEVGQTTYESFRAWELAFDKIYDSPVQKPWHAWAEAGARQLLESGATAAADVVSDIEAVDVLSSLGMHGIAYWEVMDWENEAWSREGARTLISELARAGRNQNIRLGISPHAPYSLGAGPLLDLPDIARGLGMRLHIHLGETPVEAGAFPSKLSNLTSRAWSGNKWDGYLALRAAGFEVSAMQFVDQLGVLGPDVHIAHGVYASREDRRILRQRGVSAALCPRSNRVTCTVRDAPVARYLEEGNPIAIGTDSLSSAPSLDVMDDAREVYKLAIEQGYDRDDLSHRIIRALTLGGAESMGLNCGPDRIGQINPGALADLAFFDIPVDVATPLGVEETLDYFVRKGAGSCRATLLSGELVYNHIW